MKLWVNGETEEVENAGYKILPQPVVRILYSANTTPHPLRNRTFVKQIREQIE